MALNRIGQFDFAVIQGVPGILTDSVETIERANVRGTSLRGLGRRGQQFTVKTITKEEDLAGCRQRLVTYETLVGDDPIEMVINDVDYFSNEGLLFAVLAVAPIRISKTGAINAAGDADTSGAVLYASWQMKTIEV